MKTEFEKASKAYKRVLIAKDVLKHIAINKYKVRMGTYCNFYSDENYDGIINNSDIQFKGNQDKYKSCEVCALGGLMLSLTNYNNKFTFSELKRRETKVWKELTNFFTIEQLFLIEYIFENWSECKRDGVAIYTLDYSPTENILKKLSNIRNYMNIYSHPKNSEDRLKSLMNNIIKNNGELKV